LTTYQYPPTPAGEEITEAMLQAGLPVFILKTDTVGRVTTTMSSDVDLQLPVTAGSIWWVEMHLIVNGTNTAKIKTTWNIPTGTTGNRRCLGPASNAANQTDADSTAGRWGVHGAATAITYGLPRNATNLSSQIVETGQLNIGTSDGVVALAWAQSTADTANPTSVSPSSLIKAYRLA
jgi:hypothetical protein